MGGFGVIPMEEKWPVLNGMGVEIKYHTVIARCLMYVMDIDWYEAWFYVDSVQWFIFEMCIGRL